MKIPAPFTAVKCKKENGKTTVDVWNRTYTFGEASPLFESIRSGAGELLSAPVRYEMTNKGKECTFCPAVVIPMAEENEGEARTVVTAAESDCVVVNTAVRTEYDGFSEICVKVSPRGRSIAQVFGYEETDTTQFCPTSLSVVIPIAKHGQGYYQTFPFDGIVENASGRVLSKGQDSTGFITDSAGFIPRGGFRCRFKEQVYIGFDTGGIGVMFETAQGFVFEDKDRFCELLETENEYLLKFHIFDKTPKIWEDRGKNDGRSMDMLPFVFRFFVQVTPVKPLSKRPFTEHNLHIDCFKKLFEDYDSFLSKPICKNAQYADYFEKSGSDEYKDEIGFDRLKRLGVDTLYIHEKWNDMQNSPYLTEEANDRLVYIVSECHKRGIRVIPYFGASISTFSPLLTEDSFRHFRRVGEGNYIYNWYRYPYQRCPRYCHNSEYSSACAEGLMRLCERVGFDGFYLDTTVSPDGCDNPLHGCGYIDQNGKRQVTFPVRSVREFLKKLYLFTRERGCTINVHAFGSFNLAAMSFCDSMWEGETFQQKLLHGELHEMPEGTLRAQFQSRDTGIPVYSLCYSDPPVWSYESGAAIALLHGSLPKPVDIGQPLEFMARLWKVYDGFPLENAEWKPYFDGNDRLLSDNENVKVSVCDAGNEALCICACTNDRFSGDVTLRCALPDETIADAFSGEVLGRGETTLPFGAFGLRILLLTKKN